MLQFLLFQHEGDDPHRYIRCRAKAVIINSPLGRGVCVCGCEKVCDVCRCSSSQGCAWKLCRQKRNTRKQMKHTAQHSTGETDHNSKVAHVNSEVEAKSVCCIDEIIPLFFLLLFWQIGLFFQVFNHNYLLCFFFISSFLLPLSIFLSAPSFFHFFSSPPLDSSWFMLYCVFLGKKKRGREREGCGETC